MSENKLLAGLWAASLSGAVIILTVLFLRTLFQNRTPRRVFCLLWDVVLARILILAALPSPVSVWQWFPASAEALRLDLRPTVTPGLATPAGGAVIEDAFVRPAAAALPALDMGVVLVVVWLAIALVLAAWFLWSHLRSRRLYADSLPCTDVFVRDWLAARSLHRRIQIRTSDRISAPLTYGVLRPVVLLSAEMDWPDRAALSFVLEHEFQHIRHFDTLWKGFLAATACLHWFNPLVWVMYVLYNRDLELACDEAVIEQGMDRAGYAWTLLNMEERRGRWDPSGNHFSQNALEERIKSIMKHKKTSITALIAVLVVTSIAVTVFASAAPEKSKETEIPSGQDAPVSGYVHDYSQAVEGDVMILSQGGEDGEKKYSVDGGRTWLNEEDYHTRYGGSDWQVEWWTAEDYAAWLEEEKQMLQSIIGERGYTSGEGWFTWDQKRVDEAIALYEGILENIKNGALYSKTITDKNGSVVEDTALGSGTLGMTIFSVDEEDTVASEAPEAIDAASLLEDLKAFGISGSANRMTYNGQLIRHLVDGASVGENGYSIRYVYTNLDGILDVHTLRSAIHNPDGSYDPMGELIGVVSKGETGFDQDFMNSAIFSSGSAPTTMETRAGIEREIGTELEPYKAFGLNYKCEWNQDEEMQFYMSWNGKPVHSLYDTKTGTWFANNMHGSDLPADAVDLETIYRDGILCGLQESQPPHNEAVATIATGSGTEDGRTFEEIFVQYKSYGLVYSPRESGRGSLTWNGQAVKTFADLKPDGGVFSYQNPYAERGLKVCTEYDANGNLTRLRAE